VRGSTHERARAVTVTELCSVQQPYQYGKLDCFLRKVSITQHILHSPSYPHYLNTSVIFHIKLKRKVCVFTSFGGYYLAQGLLQ